MAKVVESVNIAASPERVWSVLADFGAINEWAPNVDHSCVMSEQSHGIGASRRVQVGRQALIERVVEWTDADQFSYTIEGLPSAIGSVTNTWRVNGADVSTTVTLASVVDAGPRPSHRLIARVVGRRLAHTSQDMLAGLQHYLEAGPS